MITIQELGRDVALGPIAVETSKQAEQYILQIWKERQRSGPPSQRSGFMVKINVPLPINLLMDTEKVMLNSRDTVIPLEKLNDLGSIKAISSESICIQVLEERNSDDYEISPFLRYGRCWIFTGTPAKLELYFKEWPENERPVEGQLATLIEKSMETALGILDLMLQRAA